MPADAACAGGAVSRLRAAAQDPSQRLVDALLLSPPIDQLALLPSAREVREYSEYVRAGGGLRAGRVGVGAARHIRHRSCHGPISA